MLVEAPLIDSTRLARFAASFEGGADVVLEANVRKTTGYEPFEVEVLVTCCISLACERVRGAGEQADPHTDPALWLTNIVGGVYPNSPLH